MNAIAQALAKAQKPLTTNELEELKTLRGRLTAKMDSLMGVELKGKMALDKKIREIEEKERLTLPEHLREYKILDLSVLQIRDILGMPRLVPFSLNTSEWQVGYSRSGNGHGYPIQAPNFTDNALTNRVFANYTDLIEKARRVCNAEKIGDAYFKATFAGVIPDKAREIIQNGKKLPDVEQVFLIADVTGEVQFHDETTPRPQNLDPIICGWVPKSKQVIILGVFDPTKLENWVASEFTS